MDMMVSHFSAIHVNTASMCFGLCSFPTDTCRNSCSAIQAGYQVWTAEQECRHFRNQSAEHANVIQQSKSEIIQQEAQTEELFVVRRDQQQVICTGHLVLASARAPLVYRILALYTAT